MEYHSDATRPLPWYRDATPGGRAVILGSAVLASAAGVLSVMAGASVLVAMLVCGFILVAGNFGAAAFLQEETYDEFDGSDDLGGPADDLE